jgi:hypothetical protein
MRFYEFSNPFLVEAAPSNPRIPHPEDAIFISQAEAANYVQALESAIKNDSQISIKWDGGIALFFGTSPEGKFFINDKYMPEGFYAYSPQDWERYDTQVKKTKKSRGEELYNKIATIWEGLREDVLDNGVYKGDLMAVGNELTPKDGNFVFQPTTVVYHIPVDSEIGELIQGKVGAVVVHQRNGAPWDGKTGLANKGNVAVIAPKAGLSFKLKSPSNLVAAAKQAVNKEGKIAEQFLQGMAGVARGAIQTYFNQKITSQTKEDLLPWLEKYPNISKKQYQILSTYIPENSNGLRALEHVWNSIYALKENLVLQLENQVTGFNQITDGQKGGEGFVVPSSLGLIKLVNRRLFGAAHFNK